MLVEQTEFETWHHMALNFDIYTHFTSPIRRIIDAIIHYYLTYNIIIDIDIEKLKSAGNYIQSITQ